MAGLVILPSTTLLTSKLQVTVQGHQRSQVNFELKKLKFETNPETLLNIKIANRIAV
jgi:hypothetical protein